MADWGVVRLMPVCYLSDIGARKLYFNFWHVF